MYEIHEMILITAPPAEVWDFVVDPDNVMLYNTGLVEWERLDDGDLEKGSEAHGAVRFLGKKIEFDAEVTEFVEGKRIGWRMVDGPFPMFWEYRLVETEGRTELTYYVESEGFGNFFGRFAEPLVHKLYTREVIGMLAKIKEMIEA